MQDLSVPISAPFKSSIPWWCSVELGRRMLFLLLTVSLPRVAVSYVTSYRWCCQPFLFFISKLLPALILVLILAVYGFAQPYSSQLANYLEFFVDSNFIILMFIWNTGYFQEEYFKFNPELKGSIATITWILAPFFYFPYTLIIFIPLVLAAISLLRYIKRAQIS